MPPRCAAPRAPRPTPLARLSQCDAPRSRLRFCLGSPFFPLLRLQASLMAEVDAKTRDAAAARSVGAKVQARLAAAEHEVSLLEVQKLEMEQAAVVAEGMLRERDLALHKVHPVGARCCCRERPPCAASRHTPMPPYRLTPYSSRCSYRWTFATAPSRCL